MKIAKCPICKKKDLEVITQKYVSNKTDKDTGEKIIIPNVQIYKCQNPDCEHTWLPYDEEEKIKVFVKRKSKHNLNAEQIKEIRLSLPFKTKSELSTFLNLNSKAFVKWENGYTNPNDAYDLLLRLVAYSKDNVSFIKHLHKNNFSYNPKDYQFVSDFKGLLWSFAKVVEADSLSNKNVLEYHSFKKTDYLNFTESALSSDFSISEDKDKEKMVA